MSSASRPIVAASRPEVVVREIEGELVILDRTRGLVHQLNTTAGIVWSRCNGELTVRDIAAELATEFDVSVDTAHDDVSTTVRRLAELGLVDVAPVAKQADQMEEQG